MEAAYFGVHLWAQTVNKIGTTDIDAVKKELKRQSINTPEGVVSVNGANQHMWKYVRIGKIQSNGQFNIVWDSGKSIQPVVYPTQYRSQKEWDNFLNDLYKGWGNQWAASAKKLP